VGGHGTPQLNREVPVTPQTPPALLVQAEDDPVDDMENCRWPQLAEAWLAAIRMIPQ
jgi:hypothetical protein